MTDSTAPVLLADALEASDETRRRALRAGRRPSTLNTYAAHWRSFESYCRGREVHSLPAAPTTVAEYLHDQAREGKALATIAARRVAISVVHKSAGYPTPCTDPGISALMADLSAELAPPQGKEPLTLPELSAYLRTLNGTLIETRDRALLVVGFAGAYRRSELVAMDVEHLRPHDRGLTAWLPQTKTGETWRWLPYGKHAETCPVRLLRSWLERAEIAEGPVFRPVRGEGALDRRLSPAAVAQVVKKAAAALGHDPADFGAHSLRSGFVTQAIRQGADLVSIARQTGHKSHAVLLGYYREHGVADNNAAGELGL